mmetsp:Transcript_90437/g.256346  ORF Transcript_90437/g.256346 Transcript_90437/m.256346 type:complete len:278 (-) Transcript_90437:1348-2181(-)
MELHGAPPLARLLLASSEVEVRLRDALPGVHLRGHVGAALVEVLRALEVLDLLEVLRQAVVALEAALVVLGAPCGLGALERLLEEDQRLLGDADVFLLLLVRRGVLARRRLLPVRDVEEVDEGLDAAHHEEVDAELLLVQALHLDHAVVLVLPRVLRRALLSCGGHLRKPEGGGRRLAAARLAAGGGRLALAAAQPVDDVQCPVDLVLRHVVTKVPALCCGVLLANLTQMAEEEVLGGTRHFSQKPLVAWVQQSRLDGAYVVVGARSQHCRMARAVI